MPIEFIVGLFIGIGIGVCIMCINYVSTELRKEEDDNENKKC